MVKIPRCVFDDVSHSSNDSYQPVILCLVSWHRVVILLEDLQRLLLSQSDLSKQESEERVKVGNASSHAF